MEIVLSPKWVDECLVSVKTLLYNEFCPKIQKSLFYYYSALSPHANHFVLILLKKRSETKNFGWVTQEETNKKNRWHLGEFVTEVHRLL